MANETFFLGWPIPRHIYYTIINGCTDTGMHCYPVCFFIFEKNQNSVNKKSDMSRLGSRMESEILWPF